MTWDDLKARARSVVPAQELKAKRCWVGVLCHNKAPQDHFEELDFVWMIGHGKVSIQKIYETYQKRHPGLKFQLQFMDTIVDRSDTIKSFLVPGEDFVLFLARVSEPLQAPAHAQSLTPELQLAESLNNARPMSWTFDGSSKSPVQATHTKNGPVDDDVLPSAEPSLARTASTGAPTTPLLASNKSPIAPSFARAPTTVPQATTLSANNQTSNAPFSDILRDVERSPTCHSVPRTQEHASSRSANIIATPPLSASEILPEALNAPQVDALGPTSLAPNATAQGEASHQGNISLATPSHAVVKDGTPPSPVFHHMDQESQVDFNPENFFNREPSPEQEDQQDSQPTDLYIRDVIAQQDPKMLEAGVSQSRKILQNLKQIFSRYAEDSPDALAWTVAIEKLIPQAQRKRTVVGVVGNTGAGKSSVINAMLDEERLVPTNCMRACTAVVTEMSWNDSTDPFSKYRAQIEFIARADWEKEVGTLMKEFMTESGGVSRDIADENSDAGIAWAKFHSVYPKITRDSLNDCTVESLISEKSVLAVLGTTKKINTATPHTFYQQLQRYVDSKEKVSKKGKDKEKDTGKAKKSFGLEFWPLIKVVKIYVKAPALSTGAVIVDLPGVHDSNAARAAVAQGYMKQCTGLWIVAPINRAVDDKAAKTLLGDSFKRQLKYDGGFSSVTFICSKTDDISITEAIDTLELEDKVQELYEQQQRLEDQIKDAKEKIDDLKEEQDVYRIAQNEAASEIEVWEQLKDSLDDGETVYAPTAKSKKRKNSRRDSARKRRQGHDDGDDVFIVSDEEDPSTESDCDSDTADVQPPLTPLTEGDIKTKIRELRDTKKTSRREGILRTEKIKELRHQIPEYEKNIKKIKADISHICIAGRNDYSKRAIQQDFAAGIKELDQENAAEEDEENFNPDEELRDYDEVARSLPVFCVSSRAYQKLCGRMQKDGSVPGFKTPEETEMPQLQAHCMKLTEAGRIQTARTFLLSLCQQLTTFSLWASNDGTGLKMTDDDKRKQVKYLEKRLRELERGLEESVRACLNVMKKEMNDQIFDKYPDLINEAIIAAPVTAQSWGAHRSDGGLAWATYKAVVRRDGSYHSASAGHRDFNSDLVGPIVKKLATSWERAFQNRLPKAFDAFVKDSGKLLHNFHQAIEERARNNGIGLASLSALKSQIYTYEQLFADLNQVLMTTMTELQREANRDFTPTIANIMHTVYDICTNECGKGSFMRMKEHMTREVDRNRHHMFNDATLTVKRHLDSMCKALEDVMEARADEIYIKMKADYMRVLGGVQINQAEIMSKVDRALRVDIMSILRDVDAQFEPIARGELGKQEPNEGGTDALIDEPEVIQDNEESAFESPPGSVKGDVNDESIVDGDDTLITEPTPSKHRNNVDGEFSDKENCGLPTLSDDGMDEEVL